MPALIAINGMRVRPSRRAISLGRCARRASTFSVPALTAPPRKRNAPVTCSASSQPYVPTPGAYAPREMDARDRHLRLLTETIEAVNSTLDLEEVLSLVATKVADALGADACFVYLYDERADELVLRATHGTRYEELTRRPRMRPGEGITGTAAESRAAVGIRSEAPLDVGFKNFPILPEDESESVLAGPIGASWRLLGSELRGERFEGALILRRRGPRAFAG